MEGGKECLQLGGRKCMRAERNIQPPFTGEENAGLREAQRLSKYRTAQRGRTKL